MERPIFPLDGRPAANDDFSRLLGYTDIVSQMLAVGIGGNSPWQNFVIYGCGITQSGSNYILADGQVLINGVLLDVSGGTYTSNTLYISEDSYYTGDSRTFKDGNDYDCVEYRIARVTPYAPAGAYITVQYQKRKPTLIRALGNMIVPPGTVTMWSGSPSAIPDGYALCDGSTVQGVVTPDLRGKFIVGYSASDTDYNAIAKTGGEKQSVINGANLPYHEHGIPIILNTGGTQPGVLRGTPTYTSENTDGSTGSSAPFENRPPYYTLAYIVKLP